MNHLRTKPRDTRSRVATPIRLNTVYTACAVPNYEIPSYNDNINRQAVR